MNWTGSARTNFFPLLEGKLDEFKAITEKTDLRLLEENGLVALLGDEGWPAWIPTGEDQEDDEFSIEQHIMPLVPDGHVVILMEAGAEGMRYISGLAQAFLNADGETRTVEVNLLDIYALAAKEFEIPEADIRKINE